MREVSCPAQSEVFYGSLFWVCRGPTNHGGLSLIRLIHIRAQGRAQFYSVIEQDYNGEKSLIEYEDFVHE